MNTKEQTSMLSDEENQVIAAKIAQQRASDAAVAEFLARGGAIQQVATGKSGRVEGAGYSAWGAPRRAGRPKADSLPPPNQEAAEDPDSLL